MPPELTAMTSAAPSGKERSTRVWPLFTAWAIWSCFFLYLLSPHMRGLILGWGFLNWETAEEILTRGPAGVTHFINLPLFPSLIALCFRLGSMTEAAARITGVLCVISMPFAIYHLAKEISSRQNYVSVALIACALFLTNPAIIQGALTIDTADATLLPLLLSVFCLIFFKTARYPFWPRIFSLASIFFLSMWAKITTPLACIAALFLFFLLQKKPKEALAFSFAVFSVGMALLLGSWFLYCLLWAGLHRFLEPFAYYATEIQVTMLRLSPGRISKMALDFFRLLVWFSPPFLFLAGLVLPRVFKRTKDEDSRQDKILFMAVLAGIVCVTYAYANATFSGFPKYVLSVFPLLCCLLAVGISKSIVLRYQRRVYSMGIVAACVGVAYYYFFVGDTIYVIYLLRQAQLTQGVTHVLFYFFRQQALLFLFPAVLFTFSLRVPQVKLLDRAVAAIFIALISSNIALSLVQRRANYCLTYAYGTEGAQELRAFLNAENIRDVYTSLEGFITNVDGVTFHGTYLPVQKNAATFLAFFKSAQLPCYICGLASNPVSQLKTVLGNKDVLLYLRSNYHEHIFGSYHVFLRKQTGS